MYLFYLSYNMRKDANMLVTNAKIFGQISDLHQARMVREESEGRKKHNRGMREIEREQKKKKKA